MYTEKEIINSLAPKQKLQPLLFIMHMLLIVDTIVDMLCQCSLANYQIKEFCITLHD